MFFLEVALFNRYPDLITNNPNLIRSYGCLRIKGYESGHEILCISMGVFKESNQQY